ncbi:MAG: hypothetical protein PUC53_08730 [Bacteroidales bacterium]|nr:hypothetical protein [Bacteroidales bacterium]
MYSITKLMKFLISISSVFMLFACSSDMSDELDVLDDVKINSICKELFSNYVTIENNSLVLSADDQYLLDNGYDMEIIDLFKSNISNVNSYINEYIVETKSSLDEINLELVKDLDIPSNYDIVIEPPHGMLDTTNGESYDVDSFFAPYNMEGANCNIISAAPAAIHFVIMHATGDCVQMRVGMGDLYVPMMTSNCYASIKYQTTDSNGGKCAWIGVLRNND